MCNPRPGTRCWTDTDDNYNEKIKKAEEVKAEFGEESFEYTVASASVAVALKKRDATKRGIENLQQRIEEENNVQDLRARLVVAERTYKMQTNALAEIKNGRVDLMATLTPNPDNYFTQEELRSIVESERDYKERSAHRYNAQVSNRTSDKTYAAFCDDIEYNLKKINKGKLTEDQANALAQLRTMSAPDSVTFSAYKNMEDAVRRSRIALKSEINNVAALQSVDKSTAERFYDGYRRQYIAKFAHLPEKDQPNPPKHWVKGEFAYAGYKNDFSSNFAPSDPASLYAMYRLRSDPNAIPEKFKTKLNIASIDLETAGPEGKDGLKPEKGRIIEVGIITYDSATKKEISRYEQLIKPESLFLRKHGTGAEHVHHISVEDLADKPAWETVREDVQNELKGKTLLAQNATYETTWMSHHGDPIAISSLPVIDTLDLARKHLDLPNHKLESICKTVGVPYTDGHRATHDAKVTAEALFKLQQHIVRTWNKKPSRASAPSLKQLPKLSRTL